MIRLIEMRKNHPIIKQNSKKEVFEPSIFWRSCRCNESQVMK